ncbi:ArsR family transcriptional regulator [Lentibacter algarum]|uniref:arsenate reductase/protein-tyrosine-phosphatase family protein n=1 Tax=Lentibacter algarum TaxID=576131 RepID=UPI003BB00262
MENSLTSQLQTLGHPQRITLFKLLMRRYPDALPAGEICSVLGLKASTGSDYLSTLKSVGLIKSERRATHLHYSVNMIGVQAMTDALLGDCCKGRPDVCTFSASDENAPKKDRMMKVLFICSANSARSIMAEAILNTLGAEKFTAYSAGSQAGPDINPRVKALLEAKGHDTSQLFSKSLSTFQSDDAPRFDFVFTVCDDAANEACPAWPNQPISAHWGMADPAKATGTEAEINLAFQHAYGVLKNRLTAFVALPASELSAISLQREVDAIAVTSPTPQEAP